MKESALSFVQSLNINMNNITKISYTPEIDGLRAIAILSVLFYHANFELFGFRFTGGYLGAHLSKLKGNTLIRKTFTIVCLSVGISLFIKSIMSFL